MSRLPLARISALRQRIAKRARQQQEIVQGLLRERGPLIRGSFARQKRRCGKPGCRCARGELHDAAVLTFSEQGRMGGLHVPRAERGRVEEAAGRYRRFRQGRAGLVKLSKELVGELDALQRALTEPYPPPRRERGKRTRRGGKG